MTPPSTNVIRRIRSALGPLADGPSDTALIARFARTRDQEAFELLVWRHAAMVFRVCHSVLRDHHASEDASQAAFMALARQAASVCRRGTVAGWLFRVARRIAVKAARRRSFPLSSDLDRIPARECGSPPEPAVTSILYEELARLPEKYRVPLLLCFFEGLTHSDASRRLGWPVGTLAGRVARAKEYLQRRLTRRGVTASSAGLALVIAAEPAPGFVEATIRVAVAFAAGDSVAAGASNNVFQMAQGAIQTMKMSKLCWVAGILTLCGAFTVGGMRVASQGQESRSNDSSGSAPKSGPVTVAQSDAKMEPAERQATSSQRKRSLENLKRIALAFNNYHDANNHFPADIRDKDGKPLLSWRVAILPYVAETSLYQQFKLDQPWDSEHNLKLLAKLPTVYRVDFQPRDATHTYYQVFAGPGTPFGPSRLLDSASGGASSSGSAAGPGGKHDDSSPAATPSKPVPSKRMEPVRIFQITDGTSNTLGVVEAGPPVPWSKPADLPFDSMKPLPKLDGPFANVFNVATMEGIPYALRKNIDATILRNLIGMDDGNITPALKTLLAGQPAETPEEKAALERKIARNQLLIEESELLLKQHVELLGKKNAGIVDLIEADEEAERLKRFIEELKRMNKTLRSAPATSEEEPKPTIKEQKK